MTIILVNVVALVIIASWFYMTEHLLHDYRLAAFLLRLPMLVFLLAVIRVAFTKWGIY